MAKRRRKNKNRFDRIAIVALIVVFISIIGGVGISMLLSNHHSADFREYFAYGDGIVTVQDDKYREVTNRTVMVDNNLYLSYEYVKNNIDQYIFWDENLRKLTITTSDEVIRFKEADTTYFVNDESFELELPVKLINDAPYLPQSLIESLYDFKIQYLPEKDIVVVYDLTKESTFSKLKSNTTIRYDPSKKGVIESKLKKGESIQIFDQYDNYTKIVTSTGLVGYIKTSSIKDSETTSTPGIATEGEQYTTKPIEGKITVLWDQISNTDASSTPEKRITHDGVDVLSPTWFKFDRDKLDGTVISYADKDYVNWAHDNGYLVWGLVSDVADSYDTVVLENILPNSDYRERAIKQLLSYMSIYDLDGLNIDFEVLRAEHGDEYLQFFRELYPYMKKEGKYLSVDTYVPSEWSQYFRRADVAQSVDYFMIMAYDEHNPSTTAGPVASYNFVDKGIVDSLELIPKEKLILGVPFYTVIWKESVVDGAVQSSYYKAQGMDVVWKKFEDNNAVFTTDAESGYTVGEYTVVEDGNTVTYKAWLENNSSIQDKVELADKYDLTGVAGWRRGLEGVGVLETINNTLK